MEKALLNILVACEESQAIAIEFRKRGFNAFSCDLQVCSGGHPEFHICEDVIKVLNSGMFHTLDRKWHYVKKWDLVIAHPPCTYLTITGNRWFNVDKYGSMYVTLRSIQRQDAIKFFFEFVNCNCDHIAIENPIGIMSSVYRKPDQIISPWQFGHSVRKKTCLWLKGLPNLVPTDIVEKEDQVTLKNGHKMGRWYYETSCLPLKERAKARSKTFSGVAKAIAEQWGDYLLKGE